jgi:hypothetical protein
MKALKTLLAALLISASAFAQNVGINSDGTAPDASAMLDVKSANKGLLIPNVALTGTTDATTITTPAVSLLVYNTATAGTAPNIVTPGYYYNSGTSGSPLWTKFGAASGASQWTTTGSNIYYNTGNVGIGTSTPQSRLEVAGRMAINYAASPGFYGQVAGVDKVYLGYDGAGTGLQLYNFTSTKSLMIQDNGALVYSGNVGLGTDAPTSNLTVNGATNCHIELQSAGVAKGYIWWDNVTNGGVLGVGTGNTGSSIIFKDGKIGVGTTSPAYLLTINGGAYCNGTTWTNASDARLKRDIQPMSKYGLSTVMQLKPVTYFYKADKTNHPEVGFIAQDMQKIVPEVVSGTEGDITKGETLGLSYGNLVPVLTKAIQEQQATIEAQQKQIDELKAQNTALAGELKAEIENLKKVVYGVVRSEE